jgi:hypothetical protein
MMGWKSVLISYVRWVGLLGINMVRNFGRCLDFCYRLES